MVWAPSYICAQELRTGEHNNCSNEEFHITLGRVLHSDFKWHCFVEVCVQLVDNGAHLKNKNKNKNYWLSFLHITNCSSFYVLKIDSVVFPNDPIISLVSLK